eukprot:6032090-Pleurochrysis_carterae.AAC.2
MTLKLFQCYSHDASPRHLRCLSTCVLLVDVAFNLAVREEQAVKVAVSADEHSASKRQKSA